MDGDGVLRATFRGRDMRTSIVGTSTNSDGNLDANGVLANCHLNFILDFLRVARV